MKFIRNGKIRERIVDVVAKGILIAFSALVCLWMVSGARAAGDIREIRQHSLEDGTYAVDFVLSKPIDKDDVSVEYQRNFIQVSIKGVSAYPARTEKLKHDVMEKVFTYQYQPDLARARLLLKTQASNIQAKSSVEVSKQRVRILMKGSSPLVGSAEQADTIKSVSSAASSTPVDPEEMKVRNEIVSQTKDQGDTAKAIAADTESLPVFGAAGSDKSIVADKPKESPATKVFASLLLVVGVIGAGALGFRRFVQGKGIAFQRQPKMIDVISSQSLGPKRSIALVKVLDQHLVVGMSGDGMTLLAILGSGVNLDRFIDEMGPGASFTDTLADTISVGAKSPDLAGLVKKTPAAGAGMRASIKKRLEGFKPL